MDDFTKDKPTTAIPPDKGATVPPGKSLDGSPDQYADIFLRLLEAIERRIPLAGALIVIGGYVVIAAFGEMSSVRSYLTYLSILICAYVFYEVKTTKLSITNYVLLAIILVLLFYIATTKGMFQLAFYGY